MNEIELEILDRFHEAAINGDAVTAGFAVVDLSIATITTPLTVLDTIYRMGYTADKKMAKSLMDAMEEIRNEQN